MTTSQRLPFFSPLNVASLIFIILMCHVAVQFNRHGGSHRISHEKMAQGNTESFVKAAREHLPYGFYGTTKYCRDVALEEGRVVFKVTTLEADDKFHGTKEGYISTLYARLVEWTAITNKKTNRSSVLDAILAGGYPIVFRLCALGPDSTVDDSRVYDELVVMPDEYIPILKEKGLRSAYYPD